MARPPGILPCGCAGGSWGFPTAPPCAGGKLARIPAGHPADFPRPARRAIGAPGRAARSRRAEAIARAKRSEVLQGCRAFASGAHDARLLFRDPWAAVRRGREGRAAGEARDGLAFSRGQEPARKARPRLTNSQGRMPGERQPGWPSLWVTFLLATQEKSNSGAAGARKLFASKPATGQRPREHPPLTPTLSSLLRAAAIHGRSPRAPEGRGSEHRHGAHV